MCTSDDISKKRESADGRENGKEGTRKKIKGKHKGKGAGNVKR